MTRHSSAACGFHPQTDTGSCPPTLGWRSVDGCLQISWTTSSVSTRTATRTRSRSCTSLVALVVFEATVDANSDGYAKALELAEQHAPGRRAFAVEGTGSFGAGLTRFLSGRGERVLEVGRLRRERRSGGKTDALDAVRAARSVLDSASGRRRLVRAGNARRCKRLVAAREGAVNAKRAGLCQLRDLLITTPGASAQRAAAADTSTALATPRGNTTPRTDTTLSCAAACSRSARSPAECCS